MSKEQNKELLNFLKGFDKNIVALVMWLRDLAWDLCPQANELIYDNYNAVAVGWSPTLKLGHTICSIAIGRSSKNIHFGFYWGSELPDPGFYVKPDSYEHLKRLIINIIDYWKQSQLPVLNRP